MGCQEALLNYETSRIIQQENQGFREAIQTAQILEMEGVRHLEKTLKAPPGSSAIKDYRMVCMKLAELTGQSIEDAHSQIIGARERVSANMVDRENITGNCSGCKNDGTPECMHCMRAYSDCYESK